MKKFLVTALMLISLTAPAAAATHVIKFDPGGVIIQFIARYVGWENKGDKVRIDGDCMSACTLVLGIVDNDRVCATSRARFGFHSASAPGGYSDEGTRMAWSFYDDKVRAALRQRGWMWPSPHTDFIMVPAQELVRACR
jgi:hypothetical protein